MEPTSTERCLGRHETAAAETLAQAWAAGVTEAPSATEALLGLARAWDAIERDNGPWSALPNIARELRLLTDRLVATTHTRPGTDPWDELAHKLNH